MKRRHLSIGRRAAEPLSASEERHLFSCARCRADARLARALEAWGKPSEWRSESSFVRDVMGGLRSAGRRRPRDRRRAVRVAVAAAALLAFGFAAGAASRSAERSASTAETLTSVLPAAGSAVLPDLRD